jgi:hypothetical protein
MLAGGTTANEATSRSDRGRTSPCGGNPRQLEAFDHEIEEQSFARANVARAGGLVAGDWVLGSSRADRELLQAVRPVAWPPLAWEFVVTNRTQRLTRSAEFRVLHARLVSKLEEIGDFGTLSGDELREALDPPDAGLLVAAAPASASGVHRGGGKAASEDLRSLLSRGSSDPSEVSRV